jgi:glucosamine 6-phosphate synthetase-like amidotransferase/phosphosugar isomerase protein
MCGVAGYVGISKNNKQTFDLITSLLIKSQARGIDATGYWGATNKDIFYYKEPTQSSLFVKKEDWQELKKHNFNLFLSHARGATKCFGTPIENINNHPFTNSNKSLAFIHNGKLNENNFELLRKKFITKSNCDSELLLRIIESCEFNEDSNQRLKGIAKVFSYIDDGHMAAALGEKLKNKSVLYLFRNEHRPLWIIDVTKSLGQFFFVSEISFWEESVRELKIKNLKSKILELPEKQIWKIQNNLKFERYELEEKEKKSIKIDSNPLFLEDKPFLNKVNTKLDKEDRLTLNNADLKQYCFELKEKLNKIKKYKNSINSKIFVQKYFEDILMNMSNILKEIDKESDVI